MSSVFSLLVETVPPKLDDRYIHLTQSEVIANILSEQPCAKIAIKADTHVAFMSFDKVSELLKCKEYQKAEHCLQHMLILLFKS